MTLTLDPKGSWRRQRFEFCNLLEVVADGADDVLAKRAWAELEKMGARPQHNGDGK